jgi:cytochrome c-type biogenesis protein CcmH/NrfF
MHREVVQLVQQGRTAEEIIDAFVAQYGETVLMAPPKGGFNLVGYVLPGLGILGVGAAMLWMLMGRARTGGELAPVVSDTHPSTPKISDEEAALLEKELGDLDL